MDVLPAGDERTVYSIPEDTVKWITSEIERTTPVRGTRFEFYDSDLDIALYQRFVTQQGHSIRVMKNDKQEWGFYLQSRSWIPYADGVNVYKYEAAYPIHQSSMYIRGYTDFKLPKNSVHSFEFLDYVYQEWGIENVRVALSIKSGKKKLKTCAPESLTKTVIQSFTVSGEVLQKEGEWDIVSGHRRTIFDLPTNVLNTLTNAAKGLDYTMSDYVLEALIEKFEREGVELE